MLTGKTLNYFKHFLAFISAASGCVWISAFASLDGVPVDVTRSAVEFRIKNLYNHCKN